VAPAARQRLRRAAEGRPQAELLAADWNRESVITTLVSDGHGLFLTGQFGYQSTALANLFSGSRRIWSFVPQVTQTIFDAGRIRSGVELAEAQQRSALAQYENAIQTGFSDVSNALVQYQKVREVRAQMALLVTALQDRKRLAYMRYQGGVDTMLNALNSDQDLFVAELSLAQARLEELLSLVQLYKALGGGWQ